MRKSGLHKKIAFIFEGDPTPDSAATEPLAIKPVKSDVKPPSKVDGVSHGGSVAPDRTMPRVKPAPRTAIAAEPNPLLKLGRLNLKKKTQSPEAPPANRRQKTMTVLVGALSLVFVGVMAISMGGVGQKKPVSLPVAAPAGTAKAAAPQFDPKSWVFPDPLPAQMRNPLVIPQLQSLTATEDSMVVSGIVFSDKKPSVIIDGEVVLEGQVFRGVTVLKIVRGEVEFEKDGKRWTQRIR